MRDTFYTQLCDEYVYNLLMISTQYIHINIYKTCRLYVTSIILITFGHPCFPCSYQICELLYEKKHSYDKIIDCYLRDPLRKVL